MTKRATPSPPRQDPFDGPTLRDIAPRDMTLQNTIRIILAAHECHLPCLRNHLSKQAHDDLRAGDVYVWPVSGTMFGGIKRFTDGRKWTGSRTRGVFFVYQERNGDRPFLYKAMMKTEVEVAGKWTRYGLAFYFQNSDPAQFPASASRTLQEALRRVDISVHNFRVPPTGRTTMDVGSVMSLPITNQNDGAPGSGVRCTDQSSDSDFWSPAVEWAKWQELEDRMESNDTTPENASSSSQGSPDVAHVQPLTYSDLAACQWTDGREIATSIDIDAFDDLNYESRAAELISRALHPSMLHS